jgi:predicted metal-binding membrane protein
MTDHDRELARIRNLVLFSNAAAWILLLTGPSTLTHCPVALSGIVARQGSFQMLVAMLPLSSLAKGWALMLVAMMSPVLIPPIRHVWLQSFRQRRTRSIGLFVAGWALIWLSVGALLLVAELASAFVMPQSYLLAAGTLTALLWQFSPIKQHCLNRAHAHTSLAAFGFAADRDSFLFGVSHGIWCVGSCWALMVFAMLLPRWHAAAMATAAFLILSERLEQPVWPRWRWRMSSKLMRIVFARTQIQLNSLGWLTQKARCCTDTRW